MTKVLNNLQPQPLWNHFEALNSVPRPSKKEERIIAFMVDFGKRLGLTTTVDEVGNVIIKKQASKGMEGRQTVVLQSHLDMVHQKNADTDFDFDTQGIQMYVDGDYVKAKGTTLGADNGLGAAAIMALLSSTDIAHPPLEALFTIDEETGMTGAMGLKGGLLRGKIMLNLDTEDDDELTIGCAGGIDVTAVRSYVEEAAPASAVAYQIAVRGLTGGHSGMDIHRGRGNANKLMNRLLWRTHEHFGMRISEIKGGSLRNAIPRESFALVVVDANQAAAFKHHMQTQTLILQTEHKATDPNLTIEATPTTLPKFVMEVNVQEQLLAAVYGCPNGIHRMSAEIEGLVQTSNNLAKITVADGYAEVQCLTRGSVDSEKIDLARAIEATFLNIGADIRFTGAYPGWAPKPEAGIVSLMSSLYRELFKAEPKVNACHAGLECGILGTNYPDMEMISFGPNIKGAHSPDERVQISSVQKFWNFLLETLKRIPEA